MKVRNRFEELAKEKGVTYGEVARETKLSRTTLWRWIRDKQTVGDSYSIAKVCEYFECGIADLLVLE